MHSMADAQRQARIAALGYDFQSQPKSRHRSCNLCDHNVFVALTHDDRYGYATGADACRRCGLVFLNPVMTSEAYSRFYVDVYRPLVSAYHGRDINARTIQAEQADYAADLVAFLAPDFAEAKRRTLLDIGGSTGIVAHHLVKSFGLEGTVIDPAPLELDVARGLGLRTVTGFVEDYDAPSKFDVIVVCQTVDHLLDIRRTLAKARKIISENGVFFVDIVDFRAAYLRNRAVEAAVKIDHPYYLTESTMQAFLARAGFAVRRMSYARDHLHIGFLCEPAAPRPDYLPDAAEVRDLFREVRAVQNGGLRT